MYGVSKIETFNVLDSKELENKFENKYRNQVNLLFLEFCSNPNGNILDFSIIPKLRSLSKKLYLIIDNTWTTDVIVNPFEYDADIIVLSLSKHYSDGKCIGGAIISKNLNFAKYLAEDLKIRGKHISLPYCQLFLKGISKMKTNISKAYQITLEVAKFLEQSPKVEKVNYPLLASHPSKSLALKYFNKIGPSVLTFVVSLEKKKAIEWMKSFNSIKYKTSFGSDESKFDPWPRSLGSKTLCRLSIGYQSDLSEIVNELRKKLEFL